MDLDTKYQNLPKEYQCDNCATEVSAPMHCGHAMHLENLDDGVHWVCWMGIKCGIKDYATCCDASTLPLREPLGY